LLSLGNNRKTRFWEIFLGGRLVGRKTRRNSSHASIEAWWGKRQSSKPWAHEVLTRRRAGAQKFWERPGSRCEYVRWGAGSEAQRGKATKAMRDSTTGIRRVATWHRKMRQSWVEIPIGPPNREGGRPNWGWVFARAWAYMSSNLCSEEESNKSEEWPAQVQS